MSYYYPPGTLPSDIEQYASLSPEEYYPPDPPDAIKNQRIETAAQQQRILSEQQRKLAEDQRKAAEKSRADADNAYREAMQLSPEQYLALERIKMQETACAKGNCTFITGSVPGMVLGK